MKHFTSFSILGSDPFVSKPSLRLIQGGKSEAFTGRVDQVHAECRARIQALASQRQARLDAQERVFLADQPLKVQLASRDCL